MTVQTAITFERRLNSLYSKKVKYKKGVCDTELGNLIF